MTHPEVSSGEMELLKRIDSSQL